MKRFLFKNSLHFGSFLLAFYMLLGAILILLTNRLWIDNINLLGKHMICSYQLKDVFTLWLYALPGFIIILLITGVIKGHKFVAGSLFNKNELSDVSKAVITSIINGVIVFLTYSYYLITIPELITAFSVSFTVINAGIVSVATFYYIAPLPTEIMKTKMKDPKALLEALKLEHGSHMSLGNNVIWTTIILMASVVFISWTQVIYTSVDQSLRDSVQFSYLQAINIIQLAYLSFGIWFGLLSRLWDRAARIAEYISTLELSEPKK